MRLLYAMTIPFVRLFIGQSVACEFFKSHSLRGSTVSERRFIVLSQTYLVVRLSLYLQKQIRGRYNYVTGVQL